MPKHCQRSRRIPDLSASLLKKASSLNPDIAEPHFELGVLLQRQRKFDAAAQEFERAAALEPSDPAVHYRLAQVYDRLGNAKLQPGNESATRN